MLTAPLVARAASGTAPTPSGGDILGGLDLTVWGPGAVLVGLILSGVIVPGYLWRQERDERKRLQEIVEKSLPALSKSAEAIVQSGEATKDMVEVTKDAIEALRQHKSSGGGT